jgi:hypothetical protein
MINQYWYIKQLVDYQVVVDIHLIYICTTMKVELIRNDNNIRG